MNNSKYFFKAYSLLKISKIVLEYTLKHSQLISSSEFRQQENLFDNLNCQATMQQNTINLIKTVICWIPYPQKLKWWPQMRPFGPKLISRCCPVQKEIRTAWQQTPNHSANRPKRVGNENSQDPWKITVGWYVFQSVYIPYTRHCNQHFVYFFTHFLKSKNMFSMFFF